MSKSGKRPKSSTTSLVTYSVMLSRDQCLQYDANAVSESKDVKDVEAQTEQGEARSSAVNKLTLAVYLSHSESKFDVLESGKSGRFSKDQVKQLVRRIPCHY